MVNIPKMQDILSILNDLSLNPFVIHNVRHQIKRRHQIHLLDKTTYAAIFFIKCNTTSQQNQLFL